MKILVIVNPVSGRGRGEKLFLHIKQKLAASSLDFDLVRSERPLHTIELAAQAARDGLEAVITAAGDGTANEAINGLMNARVEGHHSTALGLLQAGTGNDFASSLGLPKKLDAALRAIETGRRRSVDIGRLKGCSVPGGRYFGNCVGIGFDAAGTIQSRKITWVSGMLAYFIAAVQTIFFYYKAPTLSIQTEHENLQLPALLVSIMNGVRIGGGFKLAPEARQDDGLFDLCIAREVSRLRMFSLIPHFIRGTQAGQPEIQMKLASRVTVKATHGSMPVQMDGEIIGEMCSELSVELLPRQLEIIGVPD